MVRIMETSKTLAKHLKTRWKGGARIHMARMHEFENEYDVNHARIRRTNEWWLVEFLHIVTSCSFTVTPHPHTTLSGPHLISLSVRLERGVTTPLDCLFVTCILHKFDSWY
jgi:hypothetical protein